MDHNWDKYFDTTSEYWTKLQALYAANEHYPKKVVKGRNLHHKFLRSWSKKDVAGVDNDDDNLVSLSEGSHFLAHFYIWKCANKGYRASAALAVRLMYRKSFKYVTAEIAEEIVKVWNNKERRREMNALFLSQLKNMPWVYNDLIVDVDGEALTVAQLIERYRDLRAAVADVEKMTKSTAKPTSKPRAKKPKTEK